MKKRSARGFIYNLQYAITNNDDFSLYVQNGCRVLISNTDARSPHTSP